MVSVRVEALIPELTTRTVTENFGMVCCWTGMAAALPLSVGSCLVSDHEPVAVYPLEALMGKAAPATIADDDEAARAPRKSPAGSRSHRSQW